MQHCSQNLLIKILSWSDTMDCGRPCILTTCLMNASVTLVVVKSPNSKMKCANFDKQSMTTIITQQTTMCHW